MPKLIQKEKEHHRLAYFEYLDCRSLHEVARRVGVSYRSVTRWYASFEWEERAKLHDQEVMERTSERLMEQKVKYNLKHMKDLDTIDQILDLLLETMFVRDENGRILNADGKPVETHGGSPQTKIQLETLCDFNDYIIAKLWVQDQQRKISGEADQKITMEVQGELKPSQSLEDTVKQYEDVIKELLKREE